MTVVKESGGSGRIISPNMTVKSRSVGDLVQDRVFARQLNTGIMRGTQGVGTGGVNIDSSNNRITVGNITLDGSTNTISTENTDGSIVGMGLIPGTTNEFGFFATNTSGEVVWKQVGPTGYIIDPSTGRNVSQDGKLPDGTIGRADAKDGYSVTDAIT